ncbi:MAG TPA: hypothetical protein VI011_11580 [Asanoa sp.]
MGAVPASKQLGLLGSGSYDQDVECSPPRAGFEDLDVVGFQVRIGV